MRIHEKASLYDLLIKDYEALLEDVRKHYEEVELIKEYKDPVISKDDTLYYPMITGKYSGTNFGLSLKITRGESTLKWYKAQEK